MPIPANIFSLRLEPLAPYLAEGISIDSELMEVLESMLPPKKVDAVDKLLERPGAAAHHALSH